MTGILDDNGWACQEFNRAQLGDQRLTERLVNLAAQAARSPAGTIAAVFRDAAEREAVFRFVESDRFSHTDLALSAHRACAVRCSAFPYVFVPTDGSSLLLSDPDGSKGLGGVGAWNKGGRGLQTMTAIALSPDGIPLGILGQKLWARVARSPSEKKDPRAPHQRESQAWLDVMHDAQQILCVKAPDTVPWFQLDRGGDCGRVILCGLELAVLFTVRAAHDRSVMDPEEYRRLRLWKRVREAPAQSLYLLHVPGGDKRTERMAMMALRFCPVTLHLKNEENQKVPATLWAVHVREVGSTPVGEQPIEWLLLSNHPTDSVEAARLVVTGYTQRWRVEQFHKLWKSDGCHVEDTQLRSSEAICKWATVLASVAMRIERIVYLSRQEPDLPADVEFNRAEIDAVILLRRPKGVRRGDLPTVGQVARWIADLGGYTGKSSGGPFGQKVLARGLDYIAPVAQLLAQGNVIND